MTDNGGVGDGAPERRLCKCHGEPMELTGRQKNGNLKWRCRVKRRAWRRVEEQRAYQREYHLHNAEERRAYQRAYYLANAERLKARHKEYAEIHAERLAYAARRRDMRARIQRKRQQIASLEAQLAEENARRAGEVQGREGGPHDHPPEALAGGGRGDQRDPA